MTLDLHGYTIHNAWYRFSSYVYDCYLQGHKSIVVITGHGQIGNEIPAWVHNNQYTTSCSRLDPNTGAYKITLIKNKQVPKEEKHPVDLTGLYKKFNKNR